MEARFRRCQEKKNSQNNDVKNIVSQNINILTKKWETWPKKYRSWSQNIDELSQNDETNDLL